jgi:NAD(P)-dependent dehydrogenase (short-subunit alcohol dehydrogenase family)
MKLAGKVAIVTGASRGIGKGISIAGQIGKEGGKALAVEVDVRKYESVENLVNKTVEHFGRLDILVNNAGIGMAVPSEELNPKHWQRALDIDLSGVFYGCQCAARKMIPQGGGSIINITSAFGLVAVPARAAYCASKAGCNMLTKVLAVEWAKKKIRVNAIAPGYIRTELVQEIIDKGVLSVPAIEKRTPMGRMGEVGELLGMAVYMASDDSSFMTGSVVSIDGGWESYGYI